MFGPLSPYTHTHSHKITIFFLTVFCYTTYLIARKSFSVVKVKCFKSMYLFLLSLPPPSFPLPQLYQLEEDAVICASLTYETASNLGGQCYSI